MADTHKKPMTLSWYSCAGLSWCVSGIRPLDGPFHPYDPLGWLCLFIIKANLMIQMLWDSGVEWDDAVPSEIENEWRKWGKNIVLSERVKNSQKIVNYSCSELHTFSDAVEVAYAAVS